MDFTDDGTLVAMAASKIQVFDKQPKHPNKNR
jgi:hypothetical protein